MPGNLNLKKSWHPGLMKNQKKLWEQEQDALKEHQRIKEREKELAAEREKQNLLKLQYGDDIPAEKQRELSNMNWMYEEAPKEQVVDGFREVNEEFTEGKKQVEDLLSGKQAVNTKIVSRMEKTMGSSGASKGASFADDPLLKIKDQEIKRLKERHSKQNRHGKDRVEKSHRHSRRGRLDRKEKRDGGDTNGTKDERKPVFNY